MLSMPTIYPARTPEVGRTRPLHRVCRFLRRLDLRVGRLLEHHGSVSTASSCSIRPTCSACFRNTSTTTILRVRINHSTATRLDRGALSRRSRGMSWVRPSSADSTTPTDARPEQSKPLIAPTFRRCPDALTLATDDPSPSRRTTNRVWRCQSGPVRLPRSRFRPRMTFAGETTVRMTQPRASVAHIPLSFSRKSR